MSEYEDRSAVTVIGLGPMGRELAGAFLDAGLRTTVWNRTPGRDAELVARGARSAASARAAVEASEVVVVCLVNYDAVDAVLRSEEVAPALKGRTVVNLSADTAARARDLGAWAADRGAGYIDGAIMTPAPSIGTADAVFLHAGPVALYESVRGLLGALGGTHTHVGEEIGRAAAYDLALLDVFWTAMSGYAHALAMAGVEGISPRELAPFAQGIAAILPPLFEEMAGDVEDGTYSGRINPITSGVSTMSHIVHASEANGIDASVMRATEGLARRVIGRGHGEDGFLRVTELLLATAGKGLAGPVGRG
ncbi:NAD(P)-dependent oxidoreductase [Streptomyces sp. NPDC005017]|uniref:NAD(P)-dependent oxidoreductase n=1 Tax=Streptomyces sp. NPDC005017 TaxID=3364706 RepID=UPI00367F0CE7